MSVTQIATPFSQEAVRLNSEAMKLLGDPNITAERLEEVDRMRKAAEEAWAKHERHLELSTMAQKMANQSAGLLEPSQVSPLGEQMVQTVEHRSDFKTMGAFFRAAHNQKNKNITNPNLVWFDEEDPSGPQAKKDMAEAVGSTGGFLVPTQFQATLMAQMGEMAIVRPRATIIPMARRSIQIPVLDQTATTAGQPHWFGGIVFYWQEENTEFTESDPRFRYIQLVANKLIAYTRVGDELLADSAVSLEAFLMGPLGFAGGAAWIEDFAFLRGDGVGKPLGILNSGATISTTRTTGGTIKYDDLVNMVEKALPTANLMWVGSQSALSDLRLMNGPAGNPSYLWGNASSQTPNTLLGYPITWTEKLPGVGTTGDLMLVDWKYYLIGDRQATTIDSTIFDRWRFGQTSWRMEHRVDGQPWLSAPFTYQDGSVQVSPFVKIAT